MESPGDEIGAKMRMRDQHNATGRQHAHQRLPHEFGIRISQRFVRDFPNFAEGGAQGFAHGIAVPRPIR